MRTVIIDRPTQVKLPAAVWELLPFRFSDELRTCGGFRPDGVEELHLRAGRCASLTVGGENVMLRYCATPDELGSLVDRACGGSLYAHADTIAEGFVSYRGVRVGVCGQAVREGGRVSGVWGVSSVVIRVPRPTPEGVGHELAELVRGGGLCSGVLVYAPPGVGKTTVLRGVAACLASGESPLRVAVVDTRLELAAGLDATGLLLDVLSGYPKAEGISTAVRTLASQVIVCDEIGSGEEEAVLSAQGCGVPLVAATHAATLSELLHKPGIARLHRARSFGWYVGLSRAAGSFRYNYDIHGAGAVDDTDGDGG